MKNSNIHSMNKELKAYYTSKSLSEDQLASLIDMQASAIEIKHQNVYVKKQAPAKRHWRKGFFPNPQNYRNAFYITAFMFLACLATVYQLLDEEPLSQRIMSEIVYNHKNDMPIEVTSNSLNDISDYLNKLNFSMVLPDILKEPEWEFLGGRYCSLNGKLAALLKIRNTKDNNVYTLYQAETDKAVDKTWPNPLSDMISGVDVSIWREKGLLLGMAIENKAL